MRAHNRYIWQFWPIDNFQIFPTSALALYMLHCGACSTHRSDRNNQSAYDGSIGRAGYSAGSGTEWTNDASSPAVRVAATALRPIRLFAP